jgi:glycosyltransferase involved in cell wall biosynthesis
VSLLLDDLLGGGAARVAAHLSRAWAEQGCAVTILTTDDGRLPPWFTLHPDVRHLALGLRGDSRSVLGALGRNLGRLGRLRRSIRASRPDVLISFLDTNNVMCLLATRGLPGLPIIISERTDPSGRPLGPAWEWLRRLTYPWADCLVAQSAHALAFFSPGVQAKGKVIPNPVLPVAGSPRPVPSGPRRQVMTLGRLNRVKGHDLLIEAFGTLAEALPDWDLVIHGEGQERAALASRIRTLGLERRILLPGATDQPGARLREADLFVLPSRTEGFPNALAEAMACGLPVISFDCASGPSELIRDGVDGLLVPPENVPALARAMARLMRSAPERARLAGNAPDVLARFSLDRILGLWAETLHQALASHSHYNREIPPTRR